jgi:hypothetical protein
MRDQQETWTFRTGTAMTGTIMDGNSERRENHEQRRERIPDTGSMRDTKTFQKARTKRHQVQKDHK